MKENNNNRRPANNRNANRNERPHNNNHQRQGRTPHNILPPARILEDYENAAPGSVNKLIDMAKKEQDHRHSWQDKYLKFHNCSYKAGLVFSFIYNVALLVLIFDLIKQGKEALALKFFLINAALIAFAIIVTVVERKITTRKPPRRIHPNQNNKAPSRQPEKK